MCIRDRQNTGSMASAPSSSIKNVPRKMNRVRRTIPPTFGAEIASCMVPVSYTHLDVYKRQRLARMLLAGEVLDGQKVVVDRIDGSDGLTLRAEGEAHLPSSASAASPA